MTDRVSSVLVTAAVGRSVLSGRLHGNADSVKLQKSVAAAASGGGVVLIDLGTAEFLSSSYFDAAIWPIWSAAHEDLYPILSNVPRPAADDIEIVLKEHGAALWSVAAKKKAALDDACLLGKLDDPLVQIIGRVRAAGDVTAGDLADDPSTESIGATAWSNRLALLHKFRLLRRRKDGRRLIYSLPWKE